MDTLHPVVRYRDNVKFQWLEDFEDQSSSLEPSGSNLVDTAHFKIISDPAKVYAPALAHSGRLKQIWEQGSIFLNTAPKTSMICHATGIYTWR